MFDSLLQTEGTIYAILHEEHERMNKWLEEAHQTTDRATKTREDMLAKITRYILSHAKAEEHILYARLRKEDETHDVSLEAIEEHRVAERLLNELAVTELSDEHWAAKMEVLRESIKHHVKEEENEMFSKAKKVLSDEEAIEMGTKFKTEKRKLIEEMGL